MRPGPELSPPGFGDDIAGAVHGAIDHGVHARAISQFILDFVTAQRDLAGAGQCAELALAAEKKGVDAEKRQALERTATHRQEIDKLKAERGTILAQMTPKIASEYERIRKGRAGVAIAEAVNGRCSKCNIMLRPQFLQELKQGNSIMVCESCRRMLYYNPPQSFDDLVPHSVR